VKAEVRRQLAVRLAEELAVVGVGDAERQREAVADLLGVGEVEREAILVERVIGEILVSPGEVDPPDRFGPAEDQAAINGPTAFFPRPRGEPAGNGGRLGLVVIC
jgi:hypothetical protein